MSMICTRAHASKQNNFDAKESQGVQATLSIGEEAEREREREQIRRCVCVCSMRHNTVCTYPSCVMPLAGEN